MKWLAGMGIIFVLSWGIGAIVCGVMLLVNQYKMAKISGLVFFLLPVLGLAVNLINEKRILYSFERAKEEVARLCAKDGGDRIYRTVENVQGVFQMRARLPDHFRKPDGTFYNAMSDQYEMEDPYGRAMGDRFDLSSWVGKSPIRPEAPPRGKHGYWFIEQPASRALPGGNGYQRSYWSVVTDLRKGAVQGEAAGPVHEIKTATSIKRLLSRYGYLTEDLTTTEMRDNWIGAGRIKIIDLQTNEVLAERKGYFRARGNFLPSGADRWTAMGASVENDRICPEGSLWSFLHAVLKPPADLPDPDQLASLSVE